MHPEVEEYIYHLSESQQAICWILRDTIINLSPAVEEKFKWKCPFYYHGKALCYLSKRGKGIDLAFAHGYKMNDESGILQDRGTRYVRHLYFESEKDALNPVVTELLHQAIMIGQQKDVHSW